MTEEEINQDLYSAKNNFGSYSDEHDFSTTVQDFLNDTGTNQKPKYLSDYLYQQEANILGREFPAPTVGDDGTATFVRGNIDYGIDMLKGGAAREGDYKLDSEIPLVDTDWAFSKFLAPLATLASSRRTEAFFTWALTKTSDSSLGNSSVINPLPQFTRYTDPRITTDPQRAGYASDGIYNSGNDVSYGTNKFAGGLGMGRYYSEALEDYQQEVFMQFGVPEFNSMFSFLTNAVSYEDTYIANHGRYPIEFGISSWVGARLIFAVYPFISLGIYAIQSLYRMLIGFSPFSYYYLKPTMTGYWGTVNTIVSSICIELGIYTMDPVTEVTNKINSTLGTNIKVEETDRDGVKSEMGIPVQFNELEMMELKTLMPGLFGDSSCYIDMYKLASTHQIINSRVKNEWALILEANNNNVQDILLGGFINDEDGKSVFSGKPSVEEAGDLRTKYQNGEFSAFGDAYSWVGKTLESTFNGFKELIYWFWKGSDSSSFFNSTNKAWNTVTSNKVDDRITEEKLGGFFGGDTSGMQNTYKEVNTSAQEANSSSGSSSSNSIMSSVNAASATSKQAISSVNSTSSNINAEDTADTTVTSNGLIQRVTDATTKQYDAGAAIINAVNRDGGLFVGFRVNATRTASESFSNSTAPIETGELIKSVSGTSRNARFSLSGGNMLPGMDSVINVAKNVVLGVLDGATFGLSSAVASALSGAFIDIPDRWESSSASLSNVTYSVRLVSPYGNPISQLQNIYIPLACLLAGVLPLQTGRSSHTSPYICNLFCKGVQNIELGIITELSIERGVSNLPFSKWKQPLAIDVSFTVTDLSGVITAPIDRGIFQALLKGTAEFAGALTTESKLDDYIGTLCARDLSNSRFIMPSFQRRMKKALLRTGQVFNSNRLAFWLGSVTNPVAAVFGAPPWAAQSESKNSNIFGKSINDKVNSM